MIEQKMVPLSRTDEAFFALVVDRYQAALQQATQIKNEALTILYDEKGIPAGAKVGTIARTETTPAYLTYAVEVAAAEPSSDAPETGLDTSPSTPE